MTFCEPIKILRLQGKLSHENLEKSLETKWEEHLNGKFDKQMLSAYGLHEKLLEALVLKGPYIVMAFISRNLTRYSQ